MQRIEMTIAPATTGRHSGRVIKPAEYDEDRVKVKDEVVGYDGEAFRVGREVDRVVARRLVGCGLARYLDDDEEPRGRREDVVEKPKRGRGRPPKSEQSDGDE